MALNPFITPEGRPKLFPNEVLLNFYERVRGTLDLSNEYRSRLRGVLYLTNARMVFINSRRRKHIYNFALHLNLIEREDFNVQFPRRSSIVGYAKPYMNYLPNPCNFQFKIKQDPTPFITNLRSLMSQIRTIRKALDARSQAFVDPNDPDIIYMVDNGKGN